MKKLLLVLFAIATSFSYTQAQAPVLWGLTYSGGKNNSGTLFNYATTNSVTVKHYFGSGNDGNAPGSSLIEATNGLLYGMTNQDSAVGGYGTLFSYDIIADSETVLYLFGNGSNDGLYPVGSLLQGSNGLLYGTLSEGGLNEGGTIFSYSITDDSETTLYPFGNAGDGSYPAGSFIQSETNDSLLYGTTETGGTYLSFIGGGGTIFSYNIFTGKETVLHSFGNGTDGYSPGFSLLQVSDTVLYGLTYLGGVNGANNIGGTIFSYNILTGKETDKFDFGGGTNGFAPHGSLIMANNNLLYGMAASGGADSGGIIFSYAISQGKETDVHDFGNGTDGIYPFGSLFQASNGVLYGMTNAGGANNEGTIFSFNDTTNHETDIYDFSITDGEFPNGNLIEDDITAGINQLTAEIGRLIVYPNPTSDFIHTSITLKQSSDLQLRLVNMLGQTVWSADAGNVSGYQNGISVADLADGVYLLEMVTGGGVETREVVVQK